MIKEPEPLDLEREVAKGREVIQALPDVEDFAVIGSASYLPAEMVQDVDFAVLLDGKRRHAGEYTSAMAANGDWRLCGDYDTDKGLWFAVRRDNLNLMVTHDRGFFERYLAATEVCKHLKLMNKADRIAVCQIVRDGKTADELIQF